MTTPSILKLIDVIHGHFESNHAKHDSLHEAIDEVLEKLHAISQQPRRLVDDQPALPGLDDVLEAAIQSIPRPKLGHIADALVEARDEITWRFDEGHFYPSGTDLGDGYINGNLNCELIGPNSCGIHADDFILGFFLLTPHTLYRDHNHLAPELYLNLTEPTGWRFDKGPWEDRYSNSIVWNPSGLTHAMRTYDVPFFSIYCWTRSVNTPCSIVPAHDWDELERALTR